MEYRHLSKMRGTTKLLWNWNISLFQLLIDCLIYNNMKSCNKQWNTLPQLWNLLISIFHSSMEFHGTRQEFHGIPWNFSMSKGKFHVLCKSLLGKPCFLMMPIKNYHWYKGYSSSYRYIPYLAPFNHVPSLYPVLNFAYSSTLDCLGDIMN